VTDGSRGASKIQQYKVLKRGVWLADGRQSTADFRKTGGSRGGAEEILRIIYDIPRNTDEMARNMQNINTQYYQYSGKSIFRAISSVSNCCSAPRPLTHPFFTANGSYSSVTKYAKKKAYLVPSLQQHGESEDTRSRSARRSL